MKTAKTFLFVLMLCFFQLSISQTRTEKKKESNKVSNKIDKTNDDIQETNASVKNSVKDSKETIDELKDTFNSLFGSGNDKSKYVVTIQIPAIEYDNEGLNVLYSDILKVKGVKNPSKSFKNGNVSIKTTYKMGADALWQSIPLEDRKLFKLVQISDTNVLLQLKTE